MNSVTQKSPYPYHDVVLDRKEEKVTLCVYNGNGYGEYDHWEISKNGHKRVHKLTKNGYKQDYWQDYVHLKIIQNVYKVLDFYAKKEGNVEESENVVVFDNFNSDDIPF